MDVIQNALTRNVGALFPDITDEISTSFGEALALDGDGMLQDPELSL
jgi:hypothetical protein